MRRELAGEANFSATVAFTTCLTSAARSSCCMRYEFKTCFLCSRTASACRCLCSCNCFRDERADDSIFLDISLFFAASSRNFSLLPRRSASHPFTCDAVASAAFLRCSYMYFFALSVTCQVRNCMNTSIAIRKSYSKLRSTGDAPRQQSRSEPWSPVRDLSRVLALFVTCHPWQVAPPLFLPVSLASSLASGVRRAPHAGAPSS